MIQDSHRDGIEDTVSVEDKRLARSFPHPSHEEFSVRQGRRARGHNLSEVLCLSLPKPVSSDNVKVTALEREEDGPRTEVWK